MLFDRFGFNRLGKTNYDREIMYQAGYLNRLGIIKYFVEQKGFSIDSLVFYKKDDYENSYEYDRLDLVQFSATQEYFETVEYFVYQRDYGKDPSRPYAIAKVLYWAITYSHLSLTKYIFENFPLDPHIDCLQIPRKDLNDCYY